MATPRRALKAGEINLRKINFVLKQDADRYTAALGRETRLCYKCEVYVDAQAHFSQITGECLARQEDSK